MVTPFGITVLDSTMKKGEIRIIKNINEILGFKITNEIGQHIFVEVKWSSDNNKQIQELILRTK